MKKALITITLALAASAVLAAGNYSPSTVVQTPIGPLKMADPNWKPPTRKNTKAFMACAEKAHGIWNQGVCKHAKKLLVANNVPVTYTSLSATMDQIDKSDRARFEELVEQERLQRSL